MSTIADFNRIDDCDKIDPRCIDGYLDFTYDAEEDPTTLCVKSSWGGDCIDLTNIVKTAETLTTLYLSPEENPNCLVYEPERGGNICIHGDDLSRIISMQKLKDVAQDLAMADGNVYMYDGTDDLFKPYDLKTTVTNINTAIQNINAAISNLQNRVTNLEASVADHENRLQTIEALLVKPTGAPSDAKLTWGTINVYSDTNAVVDNNGNATSLDKTHGLYSHNLNTTAYGDELFG